MNDSQQLLAEYAANASEAAFRELVARYLNLVYSTARRLVGGDAHLAQDVTQMVFITLANKGRSLSSRVMLGGWLHRHTCHVALKVMRGERRRQLREREAVEMNTLQDNYADNLQQVAPILDEAITQLAGEDRTAILLRYFEQRDFRSVGEALGSNEDAARMRVNRALEKLQLLLRRRGVALTIPALGTTLATGAVTAAPAGLAATISSAALASAAATSGTTVAFLKLMTTTQLKLGVTALVVTGAVTTLVIQHRTKLREENESLHQQIVQLNSDQESLSNRLTLAKVARAPRLPAPAMQITTPTTPLPAELLQSANLYALLTNKTSKLTAEQVGPYLEANRRSPTSLLAAFRTTGDDALLEEAKQKFPDDPQVAFEAALKKDISPEDRRRWLDAFKQSGGDNALANYLSAANFFKAGQADQAVQELVAASGKNQFQDYTLDRIQDDQEAYRAAGYSVADAQFVASTHLLLPQLVEMRDLSRSIVDLASSYQQAGDETSRTAALQLAVTLGRRYGDASAGEMLLSQLVGLSIERMALGAMDPASPYGDESQTVQNRLDQLAQRRTALQGLAAQADTIFPTLTDQDWISYHSRTAAFGEEAALRWLVGKYGQK